MNRPFVVLERLAVLAAVVGMCVGCSGATNPVGAPLSVSLSLLHPMTPAPTLVANVDGMTVRAAGTLITNGSSETTVRVHRLGDVPVNAALVAGASDTLAAASFVEHFAQGSNHWISAQVGATRPIGTCTGAVVVAPIRGSATDSLFIAYGSLPAGSVC